MDAHVAQHLFEKCVLGALAGRTRVLVTHQVQLLARADRPADRADRDPAWAGLSPMPVVCGADGCGEARSQFETSPMALHEVGELVFRVQRFRRSANQVLPSDNRAYT